MVKADALYYQGSFEHALVNYFKALRHNCSKVRIYQPLTSNPFNSASVLSPVFVCPPHIIFKAPQTRIFKRTNFSSTITHCHYTLFCKRRPGRQIVETRLYTYLQTCGVIVLLARSGCSASQNKHFS